MAFNDDVFPPDDLCEICGARLEDEIVIQEFADGSLARLCSECAAGATLGTEQHLGHDPIDPTLKSRALAETDPLERTRELLTPVVDLIGLQREMQAALERLAASLETFAAGVLTENLDKTATVEDRVQSLERELEVTRARLREAEALLGAGSLTAAGAGAPPERADLVASEAALAAASIEAAATYEAASTVGPDSTGAGFPDAETTPAVETTPAPEEIQGVEPASPSEEAPDEAAPMTVSTETPSPPESGPEATPTGSHGEGAESGWPADVAAAEIPVIAAAPATPPPAQPEGARHGFRIEEVQAAQRYFNESPFAGKTREVRNSLGKPRANLVRAGSPEPRAFVTIAWDIVWYQYLVDMRPEIPSDQRVVLHREGMDLDELAHHFKDKNATIDDNGRLDASELEVRLLSDPAALITEMTPDTERALEDATEEIWDQHTAPEFKWDD
jgi:ribosome-binding protein aMBF1 (putative translation factor)